MSLQLDRLAASFAKLRVVPPLPLGRFGKIGGRDDDLVTGGDRDDLAGWATFICYVNAKGERSERRISCHRLEGYGRPELVRAYCHESRQPKSFRIDRIVELIDYRTGEVANPLEHFQYLLSHGLIDMEDKVLRELAKLLVFMARCDGQFHLLEAEAIEHCLTSYVLRFGGTENDIERVLSNCRALAPDGIDAIKSVERIVNAPESDRLVRLILDSTSAVIDADGRHAPEEVQWAVELSQVLKERATAG